MELKELQEFLKIEANAGAFKEIVKALGYETPDDIQGLKKTNYELKAEKQKIRDELENLKKKLDEFNEAGYIDYKNKIDSKTDDGEKLKREIVKLSQKLSEAESRSGQIEQEYNSTLKDSIISKTLESLGFNQHKEILKQAFQAKAKVETDGNKKTVIIDDGDGLGLPADEYFKKFSTTDRGKLYLDKPVNTGAGVQGFSSGGGAKTMNIENFNQLSPKDRAAFMSSGGGLI